MASGTSQPIPFGFGSQDFLKTEEEPMDILHKDYDVGHQLLEEIMKTKPIEGLRDSNPPPFLKKTYEMVDDPLTNSIISWSDSKISFIIWDPIKFTTHLLSQNFKHSNFSSFVRQLNTYRFKKINPDQWEFANEFFRKGNKHLLGEIKRRTTNRTQSKQKQVESKQQSSVHQTNLTVEMELKILRKDRIALRQEILNMKQQQEKTEKQLEIVQERMLRMEFRQKRRLAFMSKAYRSLFLVKRLQYQKQKRDSVAMCKKRKFEQMPSTINADECQRDEPYPYVPYVISSDESVSPLEDQKNGAINNPDYSSEGFILWKKLMENEVMINGGEQSRKDQTKSKNYLKEWEELMISKV